jgi:hypothetical protein
MFIAMRRHTSSTKRVPTLQRVPNGKGSLARVVALALLAVTLLPTPARATSIALLGGASLTGSSTSSAAGVTTPTFDSKVNFGFGVALRFTDNSFLNFELGALYMAREYGTGAGSDVTFNMLEIPAMMRFTLIPILNLGAGVYYAYRIGGNSDGGGPAANSFNKSDLGLVASVGLDFPLGPGALVFDARYLFGLSSIEPASVGTLYTRNWEFLAGFRLGL